MRILGSILGGTPRTRNGRLIFIHHQCWEVLPFCRFQCQRCIKILCPKDPDFYTPLALKTAKGQHLPALVVYKNHSLPLGNEESTHTKNEVGPCVALNSYVGGPFSLIFQEKGPPYTKNCRVGSIIMGHGGCLVRFDMLICVFFALLRNWTNWWEAIGQRTPSQHKLSEHSF